MTWTKHPGLDTQSGKTQKHACQIGSATLVNTSLYRLKGNLPQTSFLSPEMQQF